MISQLTGFHALALLVLLPYLQAGHGGQTSDTSSSSSGTMSGIPPRRQVSRAADRNRDGVIEPEEWHSLLAELDPGSSGRVSANELMVRITVPMIERSEDGTLTIDDLLQIFAELDGNEDDALDAQELTPRSFSTAQGSRRRTFGGSSVRMALVAVRPADANDDGEIDPDEWGLFIDSLDLEDDDSIAGHVVLGWIEHEIADVSVSEGFSPAGILDWIQRGIDRDGDGVTEVAFMQDLFDQLDDEGDGRLTREEMRSGRGSGFGGASAISRAKPALMPWQRNLEDALALVKATQKPLLICVNMDDEFASESFAWSRYRDPKFVRLVEGFVPILASPSRHNPRDYDDRGRRITDERFGRLVGAEFLGLEPALFGRYFGGKRAVPRHLGVAPDGAILFDIYLDNDLSLVDAALREHGRPSAPTESPAALDEAGLLASPDAVHRERLEQLFVEGNEETRARLAALALAAPRATQHPELLRLALADPSKNVRISAVWTMVQHPSRAPFAFFQRAFQICRHDARASAALLTALGKLSGQAEKQLHLALLGLREESTNIDVSSWRTALAWAAPVSDPIPESRDKLLERLALLESELADNFLDPERNLAFAAVSMQSAQFEIRRGRNPRFLLEDVIAAGRRCANAGESESRPEQRLQPVPGPSPDGRALAYIAWAEYLLSDMESAASDASRAVQHLIPWAGTPLAAKALELLADTRMRAMYALMQTAEAWPGEWRAWIAEVRAAHAVLLEHPHGTEQQALTYLEFLNQLSVVGPQEDFLRAALARFPLSGELHAKLREQVLRDSSARRLEDLYATRSLDTGDAAARNWYAGLAWLMAAERHVQNRATEDARDAYTESARRFQSSASTSDERVESASHYACLTLAGLARLEIEREDLTSALTHLRAGVTASPESVWKHDGLGNSPRETAQLLYRSLMRISRSEDATRLRSFLADKGLELEG